MQRISPSAQWEVERALKEYLAEVEASELAHLTKATYTEHARNYVRWLKGEFVPPCLG
jgi:hypothetical protein